MNAAISISHFDLTVARPPAKDTFEAIPARILKIDSEYQRPLCDNQLRALVRQWDRRKIGGVMVSRRAGGDHYIIDGQHRVEALLQVEGRDAFLDCIVRHGLTVEEEADLFAALNGRERRAVHVSARVRALVKAGDPLWLDILRLLERHEIQHCWRDAIHCDRMLKCWSALEYIYTRGGVDLLDQTFRVVLATWDGQKRSLENQLLSGMADFLVQHRQDDAFDERRVVAKLRLFTIKEVLGKQNYYKGLGRAARPAMTCALRHLYNSGIRNDEMRLVADRG